MYKHFFSALLASFCLASSTYGEEQGQVISTHQNTSGRKIEKLQWLDTEKDYVQISYPNSFDPKKTYSINFWFPGTGGIPSSGIEDQNNSYIGIGLSYLDRDKVGRDKYGADHWQLCKAIEQKLVARTGLKVGSRIVSGVSKGGWMAYYISQEAPKDLHGIAIIAAGKHDQAKPIAQNKAAHLAVLIGTGEIDSNYPYAQIAVPFYRASKVKSLFYEEWLGMGHVSHISSGVTEWLDVQAKRGQSAEKLTTYCEQVVSKKLEAISTLQETKDKYISLRHLMHSPAMVYTPKSLKKQVQQLGKELTQQPNLKPWLLAFKKFQGAIAQEKSMHEKGLYQTEDFEKFINGYKSFALESEHSDLAARAAYAYLRNVKLYTIAKKKDIDFENPLFQQKKREFEQLKTKLNQIQNPTPSQINNVYEAGYIVHKMTGEIGLKAFKEVEWENKYTLDPKIQKLLNIEKKNHATWKVYSGVGY